MLTPCDQQGAFGKDRGRAGMLPPLSILKRGFSIQHGANPVTTLQDHWQEERWGPRQQG